MSQGQHLSVPFHCRKCGQDGTYSVNPPAGVSPDTRLPRQEVPFCLLCEPQGNVSYSIEGHVMVPARQRE